MKKNTTQTTPKLLLKLTFLLFSLLLLSGQGWAQTTVFTDDFSTNTSTAYIQSGVLNTSAWTVATGGTANHDFGARRNTSPAQLELTNDAGFQATNQFGWAFPTVTLSSFSAPFNPTLGSNTGLITWTFNFRTNRTSALAGFGATSSYGMAMVLASTTNAATTGNGYAVVMGGGTANNIALIRYSSGLQGTRTTIIGYGNTPTAFTDYISVKVTYDPATNNWSLYSRDDGSSAFADPASGTLTQIGTATSNTTYTSTTMTYMGAYWQGSTGATQTSFFDNVKVTVVPASSAASDIIANTSFTYPANIDYTLFQGTTPLTTGNSIEVGQFDIRDGGSAFNDADALATTLTGLTLNVANSGSLRRIALFDGSTNIGEVAGGATATFSGLTLTAADNASKTFSIRVSFLSGVTDNQQFSFTVNSATASGSGSGFAAANAGGAGTSITGDNNRIEVTSSDIIFDQNVSIVALGAVMSPSPTLRAIDANVNYDLDYNAAWTVAVTTGVATFDGTATTAGSFSSGLATLNNLKFNASGTGNILTVTSGSFNDISSSFEVTNPQPEINIKETATNYLTGSTYAFGNQLSGSSSSTISFTIENTGTATLNLTGSPNLIAKSGANSSEFTINEASTTSSISAGGTTTFTVTFSPTSQGAKTAQLSIANDDATGSENPYIINLTGTATVSAASDIASTGGYAYTSNVDYASYQATSTLTTGNSVGVNGLTIRDGAGSSDADNLGTTLTAISFTTGGSTFIRTAALFDGPTNISEVAVGGATTITFSGLSLSAADNGNKDFELRVTYMNTVTDNQQITFTVSAATAASSGSAFTTANAGAAASTATGDINRIEVTASKFNFSTQPSNTTVNTNFSAAVEALDVNNNRDLDATTAVTLSASAGILSSAAGLTQNLAAGVRTWSDLQNNTAGTGITLSATGSLTTAVSNPFNVSSPVYSHDFGTSAITTKPFTDAPVIFATNLSNSSWTTSSTFGGLAGNTGASLSISNSSGTPTFTLTFNIALGYQLAITAFDFWRVRSNTGAQNWAMTINGTSVGSGTIPTTGAAIGQTNVSSAISGLTGTVTVVYTMSGASGTGSSRLDDFTLFGEVTLAPQPEIDVQGNGISIVDGDVTPSATDWTDFGSAVINSGSIDRTFTVFNTGTVSLTLTATPKVAISGAAAADFSITTLPSSPIAAGGNTTFVVHFAPTLVGTRTATLTIANDDINENPYDFVIQGLGYTAPCQGTPVGGTASATITSAICSTNSDLSLSGYSNETGITLQWQYYDGSNWQDISSATTNPYTVSGITATTQYRCNVTCSNSAITVASATVTVTVTAAVGGTTTATINPLCSGSSSVLSLTGATATGVTYSWESSTDGVNYSTIGGAASSTYTASPTVDTYYKCKLTCSASAQYSYSTPVQITMNTTATNVTSPSASVDNLQSMLSWTKVGCLNEILIVASAGSPNTATVSGDGSAYTASAVFSNGTPIGNGYVVYKGNGTTQLLTGLSNGTIYYYKFFTRNGNNWSSGVEVSATPSLLNSTINNWINTGSTTAWCTGSNWYSTAAPTSTEVAQWNNAGSAILCGITFSTCVPSILGIEVTSSRTRTLTIGGTGSTSGNLTLNGGVINNISNVIIRNASAYDFTLQPNNSNSAIMGITMGNITNNIVNIDGTGNINITSAIGGTGPLTKDGAGTGVLYLGSSNTYTGGTVINSGTISVNGSGRLGDASGSLTINNGTLQLTTTSITNATRSIILGHTNSTFDVAPAISYISTSGIFSGSGNLNKTGAGILELQAANTYNGSTYINAGTLRLNRTGGTTIPVTNNVIINGGTLQLSTDQTLNNLDLTSGNLTIDNGVTLTVNGTFTVTAGSISGTGIIVYGTNGVLKYSGNLSQTATNTEFPSSSGPKDLIIDNTAGLTFGLSRTLSGNLTINTAKNLTLNATAQLSVNGTLTNNAGTAGLILKSDATSTASLIHSNTGVNASVERYITAWTIPTDGWRLVSSPVGTTAIGNFVPTVGNDDFYRYNEVSNTWESYNDPLNPGFGFTNGNGYLCAYATGGTKTFTATVNTDAVSFTNLSNTVGQGLGWQLLGNPFASPLKWNDGNWNLSNIDANAKILNSGATYTDIAPNDIIPSMQGFWVHVSTDPGSLTIAPASRTHSSSNILNKASNDEKLLIKAVSTGNNTYTESVIKINDNATNNFDKDYDSHFLPGMYGTPQFYSQMGNDKLSTNCIPSFSGSLVIPMGFSAGVATNYSLIVDGINSFTNYTSITLEDTKTNTFQNLMQNQVYNFASTATDNPMRFRIHFNAALAVGEINGNTTHIYAYENNVYVNSGETIKQIAVYNTLGQLVKTIYPHTDFTSFSLNGMPSSYYIVKLISDKNVYSEKVFVR